MKKLVNNFATIKTETVLLSVVFVAVAFIVIASAFFLFTTPGQAHECNLEKCEFKGDRTLNYAHCSSGANDLLCNNLDSMHFAHPEYTVKQLDSATRDTYNAIVEQYGHKCNYEDCKMKGTVNWSDNLSECIPGSDCFYTDSVHYAYPALNGDEIEEFIFYTSMQKNKAKK